MNFGDLRRGGRAGLLDVGCHQSALVSTLCFAMFGPLCTLFANLINAAAEGSCEASIIPDLMMCMMTVMPRPRPSAMQSKMHCTNATETRFVQKMSDAAMLAKTTRLLWKTELAGDLLGLDENAFFGWDWVPSACSEAPHAL